ncbi:MAG TPA: hypothetical protein VN771_05275 [Candidatus Baltobacteraceae bacterium]|nr:hypothetical protein [Candidatus Baltobacteraceae bacterium]
MGPLAVLLLVAGAAALALGAWQAWGSWGRWRALLAHEANLRRYDSWRGGRPPADAGPSSADLMAAELRGQVLRWGGLALVGFVLIVLALAAHPG